MSAAQKVEQVLETLWRCKPGEVFEGYGAVCDSTAHTHAMYRAEGCEFAAEAAEQIVAALGEPTVEYGVRYPSRPWRAFPMPNEDHARSLVDDPESDCILVARTVLTGEWMEVCDVDA